MKERVIKYTKALMQGKACMHKHTIKPTPNTLYFFSAHEMQPKVCLCDIDLQGARFLRQQRHLQNEKCWSYAVPWFLQQLWWSWVVSSAKRQLEFKVSLQRLLSAQRCTSLGVTAPGKSLPNDCLGSGWQLLKVFHLKSPSLNKPSNNYAFLYIALSSSEEKSVCKTWLSVHVT